MTDVPPPGEVTVLHVGSETVSLGLAPIDSSVRYKLHIEYSCDTQCGGVIMEDSSTVNVEGLHPGTEYTLRITRRADNGNQSEAATVSVFTGKSDITQCCWNSNFIVYQYTKALAELNKCFLITLTYMNVLLTQRYSLIFMIQYSGLCQNKEVAKCVFVQIV